MDNMNGWPKQRENEVFSNSAGLERKICIASAQKHLFFQTLEFQLKQNNNNNIVCVLLNTFSIRFSILMALPFGGLLLRIMYKICELCC